MLWGNYVLDLLVWLSLLLRL